MEQQLSITQAIRVDLDLAKTWVEQERPPYEPSSGSDPLEATLDFTSFDNNWAAKLGGETVAYA